MRADAQRNRAQILNAARDVFVDLGPEAPLEEIARRAGVGIATLYRRFPDRDALIRAVGIETLNAVSDTCAEAAELDDAFSALAHAMHATLDLKVGAVMPSVAGRIPFDDDLDTARVTALDTFEETLHRAQRAGLVREDVEVGDITLLIVRLTRPLPGPFLLSPLPGDFLRSGDIELAHRQLDIYLDGLRAPGTARSGEPLRGTPPGREVFEAAREAADAYARARTSGDAPAAGHLATAGGPPAVDTDIAHATDAHSTDAHPNERS